MTLVKSSEYRLDRGSHFVDGEWFCQDIVRAERGGLVDKLFVSLSRQKDDGGSLGRGIRPDCTQQAQPVHFGNVEIRDHQVMRLVSHNLIGLLSIAGNRDPRKSESLKPVAKQQAAGDLIIDNESLGSLGNGHYAILSARPAAQYNILLQMRRNRSCVSTTLISTAIPGTPQMMHVPDTYNAVAGPAGAFSLAPLNCADALFRTAISDRFIKNFF